MGTLLHGLGVQHLGQRRTVLRPQYVQLLGRGVDGRAVLCFQGLGRLQAAYRDGISSYPHPRLMGDFWQFPTVSMGLGPRRERPKPLVGCKAYAWAKGWCC